MRVIVVGAGVVGTMHAWHAVERGHEVVQIERESEARGASLRNFGQIWVSGRAGGEELDTALRARELWEGIGERVPGIGFRANGSLTLVRDERERAVAEAALARPDAAARGYKLLTADEARALNPALRGDFLAALWCERDAAVEPRTAQLRLREALLASPGYTFLPDREVREVVGAGAVRDDHGEVHGGDVVVLATGAWLGGLVRELAGPDLPVRRVRLQMMQTEPLGEKLTTSVADADSFRYYPAYASPALDVLNAEQAQTPTAAAHKMQLLMVQRADGGLTIGDTHEYEHPFAFDTLEDPYDHLTKVVEGFLGRPLPKIRRRWAGVYAQCVDTSRVVHRQEVRAGVWLVTGPGGRGMTCSPAIAERTADELGW
ncbi:TIGR03364 family FAD-dependent oxidoreductase [Streptomyces alfalfae]|uniref:FAD-dependent oxidoreductase n=1 Tax=Streptomyces alfalfae TaxID=1642299 RepID=A0ABM6GWU6_9ACTN|nr:TIGR03364 family FAD-dependent oxidoreductase [Streptomyces alfalfae]AYA18494.1 TIGR03364 family FAD-dependent oxidoreductase [Streptomyces fradiae]APY88111.1 FAD-dependent oxidoreductase [Streptomyces alfalfae]QUI31915.1 TIGR03364 family FAD-dependent oxidoreductase [Streptomyces alfalfae]RXX46625.1 TIGR03364 family FAD-dependent oxidoreductase [Streptomyces alfalfae]RZM98745.1 TIGR03364 family FAD-dependent oxidoreductase [Streptomyces alfalfae]